MGNQFNLSTDVKLHFCWNLFLFPNQFLGTIMKLRVFLTKINYDICFDSLENTNSVAWSKKLQPIFTGQDTIRFLLQRNLRCMQAIVRDFVNCFLSFVLCGIGKYINVVSLHCCARARKCLVDYVGRNNSKTSFCKKY